MLNDSDESIITSVYELFDFESRGKLDVTYVYLIFLLVCAMESKQLLEYLHKFGRAVFELLSSRSGKLSFDRWPLVTAGCSLSVH